MLQNIFLGITLSVVLIIAGCGSESEQQAETSTTTEQLSERMDEFGSAVSEKTEAFKENLSEGVSQSESQFGEMVNGASDQAQAGQDSIAEAAKDKMGDLGDSASGRMEQFGTDLSDNTTALKESVSSGMSKAQKSAGELSQNTTDRLSKLGDEAADKAQTPGDALSGSAGEVTDTAKASTELMKNQVKQAAADIESTESPLSTADQAAFTPAGKILDKITFQLNSSKLDQRSESALNSLAEQLQQQPAAKLEIAGYTDNAGADEYNQSLSQKRANIVRQYLVSKGVNADNLTVRGFGKENPIADNATQAGRVANRRVELRIIE